MRITLVRHGETDANYDGIMQGRGNNLLSDTGRRQCQRLRLELEKYHFDVCYMSPLVRAVETAMILVGDRVLTIPDDRIIERDLGSLEGKSKELYDIKKYWNYDLNSTELGVEGIQSVFNRCRDFLDYILEKHDGKDILIVTHSAIFKALYYLLKESDLHNVLGDIKVKNCACKTIEIKKIKTG